MPQRGQNITWSNERYAVSSQQEWARLIRHARIYYTSIQDCLSCYALQTETGIDVQLVREY